ncbi:MAG: glycoside hydrolase, partial [Bacteroidales bacterium]|nr:glycoside hydrolase [Bacteroidales bacterium]
EAVAACDNHLNYGVIGSKTVPRMLTKYGYVDQAYAIAVAPGEPSYADWVRKGYTTSLEMWVAKENLRMSDNHVFLGDIVAWMMSDLTGIQPDPESPGFSHFYIRPHFPEGLEHAAASYQSVSGTIKSSWKRRGNSIQMEVTVPGNTSATVEVGGELRSLKAGKHRITIKN